MEEILTEALGIEVEDEGSWEKFILYKKKNYIKLNPTKRVVKGMTGKKKSVSPLVRKVFQETLDQIEPKMNNEEMLDIIYANVDACEKKIKQLDIVMADIQSTMTLSKDVEKYKVRTPLVQAIENMKVLVDQTGGARKFGKKGVTVEFVADRRGWIPTQFSSLAQINIKHYVDQLHKTFRQLTLPLGKSPDQMIESNRAGSLDDFFDEV